MTTLHATAVERAVHRLTHSEVVAIENRQNLDIAIKKMTMERDAIDASLRNKMEEKGALVAMWRGVPLAQLVPWGPRRTIDATRLREEKPDLAEEYTKVSNGLTLKYPS